MKKSSKIFMVVAVSVVVGVVILVVLNFMRSNEVEDSPFLPVIGIEEMHAILDDETDASHFVYIGRSDCPACRHFEPIFIDLLAEMGQTMQYFEIQRLWAAGKADEVNEVIQRLGEVRYVPSIAFIQNGEALLLEGVDFLIFDDDDETKDNLREFFDSHGGLQ